MNAYVHAQISMKRRGGRIEDYIAIHDFMDSTKELCSDNRHRILHTMWGVKRVIVPIFGQYFTNSEGKVVNVKDMCEQDHILPDYKNRFIPTLSDFVKAIDCEVEDAKFKSFSSYYENDMELMNLLLSPLSNTGMLNSLLITHNSWFINEIVPKVLNRQPEVKNFDITPSDLFDNMRFELWMDNGNAIPNSAKLTAGKVIVV
jgi:hypothetical protein